MYGVLCCAEIKQFVGSNQCALYILAYLRKIAKFGVFMCVKVVGGEYFNGANKITLDCLIEGGIKQK